MTAGRHHDTVAGQTMLIIITALAAMGLLLQTRSCLANLPQCLTFYTYLFVGRVVCLSWFIFIVNLIQTEVIQKEEPHLREWFVGSKILRQKLVPGSGGLRDRLDCFSWHLNFALGKPPGAQSSLDCPGERWVLRANANDGGLTVKFQGGLLEPH